MAALMVRDRPSLERSKQERLSVSVPANLVGYVRELAHRRNEAQSAIVAEALRRMLIEERREQIIEALIEDAAWHQEIAREGMAASPVLPE